MTTRIENAICTRATAKAILVEAPELTVPVWIPQSAVHDDSEVWKAGQTGRLVVVDWFAEKEGWL